MTVEVAVAGATGYAGGEALRLLLGHPQVTIGAVTAGSSAGSRLGSHAPNLVALADRVLAETSVESLAGADVVVLALPHGHSHQIAAGLPADTVVLDCGADHRLVDPAAWQRWYGGQHPGTWTYGLPELPGQRDRLRGARRVAVPGCYPTVSSLALVPAVAARLVEPQDLVVVAASGTSGAGRGLTPHLLGSEVMGQMSAYGVGGAHRHTPEIIQNLSAVAGTVVTVSFTPTLAPMPRGILATASGRVRPGVTTEQARECYQTAWADEPFVRLLPEGVWPGTGMTLAANTVVVQVVVDPDAGRLVAVAAVDNLTKGTAGAAVQCLNLALGLDETLGLTTAGVQP